MYDIIIIGAGPAGIYGTYYANFNGLKVLLLEIDHHIGGKPIKLYPRKLIYDFPAINGMNGKEFINELIKQLKSLKKDNLYTIKTNVDIVNIKFENNKYVLYDKNNYKYESEFLIFATGYTSFKYRTLNNDQVKTKKIFHHFVDDINKFKNKKVIILGGGDSAFDYANLLSSIAKQITLIHHSDNFKAHYLMQEKVFENKKIKILSNRKIEFIDDEKILVKNQLNNEIQNVLYDEILICYGIELLSSNLSKTGILNNVFKIEVNDNLESIYHKNIFAVGEINNLKRRDLILFSINDIVKIILYIMEKKNIKFKRS